MEQCKLIIGSRGRLGNVQCVEANWRSTKKSRGQKRPPIDRKEMKRGRGNRPGANWGCVLLIDPCWSLVHLRAFCLSRVRKGATEEQSRAAGCCCCCCCCAMSRSVGRSPAGCAVLWCDALAPGPIGLPSQRPLLICLADACQFLRLRPLRPAGVKCGLPVHCQSKWIKPYVSGSRDPGLAGFDESPRLERNTGPGPCHVEPGLPASAQAGGKWKVAPVFPVQSSSGFCLAGLS